VLVIAMLNYLRQSSPTSVQFVMVFVPCAFMLWTDLQNIAADYVFLIMSLRGSELPFSLSLECCLSAATEHMSSSLTHGYRNV